MSGGISGEGTGGTSSGVIGGDSLGSFSGGRGVICWIVILIARRLNSVGHLISLLVSLIYNGPRLVWFQKIKGDQGYKLLIFINLIK